MKRLAVMILILGAASGTSTALLYENHQENLIPWSLCAFTVLGLAIGLYGKRR